MLGAINMTTFTAILPNIDV